MENIIIGFEVDPSGLKPGVDALQNINAISKEQAEQFKKDNALYAERKKRIDEWQAAYKAFNAEREKDKKGIDEIAAKVKQIPQNIASGAIQQAAESMQNFNQQAETAVTTTQSIRAQLRQMTQELAAMEVAGQQNTAEYAALARRAGELRDNFRDAQGAVRALSSDTRRLDAVMQGVTAAAAGFAGLQGAMALLGEDGKELEQTLLKVNAAMSILQATQAIANALQHESALMMELNAVKTVVYEKALEYATIAETEFGIAAEEAMGAATAGISVLIGLIAAAAYNFSRMAEEEKKHKDLENELAKQQMEHIKTMTGLQIEYDKATGKISETEAKVAKIRDDEKKALDELARKNMALLGQKEASVNWDIDARNKFFDKHRDELKGYEESKKAIQEEYDLKVKIAQEEKATADAKKENDELIKKQEAQAKSLLELQIAIYEKMKTYREDDYWDQVELTKKIIALKKIQVDQDNSLNEEGKVLKKGLLDLELEDLRQAQAKKNSIVELSAKTEIEASNMVTEIKKVNTETLTEIERKAYEDRKKQEAQALEESKKQAQILQQVYTAAFKLIGTGVEAMFAMQQQNREQELTDTMDKLDQKKQRELDNANLTADQKAAIEKRYQRETARLKAKAWQDQHEADLTQAEVNMALAVTNALATTKPFLPAAILAGILATASGVAQIATIKNQKQPNFFAKGTKNAPEGMAWVGEEGPELMYLPGGTRVIPHQESVELLAKWNIPTLPNFNLTDMGEVAKSYHVTTTAQGIDYSKLGKHVAQAIVENKNWHFTFDKDGFATHVIEKGQKKTYLDNYFQG